MTKQLVILEQIVSWKPEVPYPEGVDPALTAYVHVPSVPDEVRELERKEVEPGEPINFDLSRYPDARWVRVRTVVTGESGAAVASFSPPQRLDWREAKFPRYPDDGD